MNDYKNPKTIAAVNAWKKATSALEKVRQKDITNADTIRAMKILGGAINSAILQNPASNNSGLVIQQKWFKQMKS